MSLAFFSWRLRWLSSLFLFILPLCLSAVGAFRVDQAWGLGNFWKSFDLYSKDILFSAVIVGLSTILIGCASVAIGGYLTLGTHSVAVAILRWLYRWPNVHSFHRRRPDPARLSAKNGMMNNVAVSLGLMTPLDATSFWIGAAS